MIRSIAVLLFLSLSAVPSAAATPVGAVERVHGVCTGTVDGETRTLAANAPVHLDEEIVTGPDARIAIVLDDDTVLTIGENARLTIDAFVHAPTGTGVLDATISGAFRYVSGALGQGATPQARVTTPVAVIGVRGTDFWGGPIDGGFGVALFEGSISVTSGGVTTVLDAAGSGVNLPAGGGVPDSVTTWPDEKVQRAMSAVAFP